MSPVEQALPSLQLLVLSGVKTQPVEALHDLAMQADAVLRSAPARQAVPPALPACLTIATVFSIGRLRKRGVFVTGPHTIAVAGQLDVVCFDKTGTLTEQGLELQGIVPVRLCVCVCVCVCLCWGRG